MTNLNFDAVIFDLDGVITQTALVHAHAWKAMFDDFLKRWSQQHGTPFVEFTHANDYLPYVDGKPRYDGVASFLKSRGIEIPYGTPDDSPEEDTVCGLGNRKNETFNQILERDGVDVYPSTVELIKDLKQRGIKLGVASSSKNCEQVLQRVDLLHYFETRVDGVVSAELGLTGKPAPDIFTKAADNLGVSYHRSVVVEDAVSGVQAGHKGNFGLVIGIAREGNEVELKANGADIVVKDLDEIDGINSIEEWFVDGLEKDSWNISLNGYKPGNERSRESLLTTGNGYFGTRGSLEENQSSPHSYPGTYLAGGYNRLKSKVGDKEIENEDFVNFLNWTSISFKVSEDDWFNPEKHQVLELNRTLNLKEGVLCKKMVVRDDEGRETLIESKRIVSMANQHHAAINYSLTPLNYSDYLRVKSELIIPEINDGVERYKELNQKHLSPITQGGKDAISFVHGKTNQSGIEIAAATRLSIFYQEQPLATTYRIKDSNGQVNTYLKAMVKEGETLRIEKLVSICSSLSEKAPLTFVQKDIEQLKSYHIMYSASARAWGKLWDKADIQLHGDRLSQKLLRLHIYHTLTTTSSHNEQIDFGIPARGLHGEAYRGHIFWDELYILPFHALHFPEVAKSVLMYRYRRLPQARAYAKQHGYAGAMFPWQSGSDGREETQIIHLNPISGQWGEDNSSRQRHISIAIAYNVWNYFNITGDMEFMEEYGAELFLDICKFWASISTQNSNGKYSITGVMGPDEFHEMMPNAKKAGLTNNAYTNLMVSWLFKQANQLVKMLPKEAIQRIKQTIEITPEEIALWGNMANAYEIGMSEEGIIEQFEGYFSLKELDWEAYRKKYSNIQRMDRILKAEGKSPDAYKVAKQPDTLMTFYNIDPDIVRGLLADMGYSLPTDFLKRNFDYYIQRCSHGSTLSRVVHAYIASLTGRNRVAWDLYAEALQSDYSDIQGGTTAEGVHMGVMTGTVLVALTAFAGINFHAETLSINPSLPPHWESMEFGCTFRGTEYRFSINRNILKIEAGKNNTQVIVKGKAYALNANEEINVKLS